MRSYQRFWPVLALLSMIDLAYDAEMRLYAFGHMQPHT